MTWLGSLFGLADPAVAITGTPPPEPPWQDFDGGLETIPIGLRGLVATYGDIKVTHKASGEVVVDRAWERASMMTARNLPGYAKPLYVHRLVEPYLREALRRCLIAAPDYRIGSLGCFAPRHMRHDPARPLSYHSWGVAIDIDSGKNSARYVDVEPWSPDWMKLWPQGLPRPFVEAFEATGFEWGGRWGGGFKDNMHFQLVKTR